MNLINKLEIPIDSPEPLPERHVAPKFPMDALGPVLGEAAKRLAYHVQAPEGMAGQSVLAAVSLIAQSHINAKRGPIGIGPVSIFCLTVAESGDRKSTLDRLALAPIREYEKQREIEVSDQEKRYKTELKAWQMCQDALIASYTKAVEMSPDKQKELAEKLFSLEQVKPISPSRSNITFSEPTAEGIWKHYIQGEPSAGLFSDEGISFFGGHGMSEEAKGRSIHMLSKLWDGDPLIRTRGADGESGTLSNRRLASHLMVQPVVSAKVLADPLLQGQGFLARFLVCHEASLAGTRLLAGRDLTKGPHNDPAIVRYWSILTRLLSMPMQIDKGTGGLELITYSLEDDALAEWCLLHDRIEEQIRPDGKFISIKAFASKAPEHAARIASILAFVDVDEQPTVEHVKRAGILIFYYLESMVIRTMDAQEDVNELLANDLLQWIKENNGKLSAMEFKRLPNSLRSAETARNLLRILVDLGHICVSEQNIRSGKGTLWEVI